MRQKLLVQKLKEVIKEKCARVNELNKIIGKHPYLFKKVVHENEQETAERGNREETKRAKECSVSFDREKCIFLFTHSWIRFLFFRRNKNNWKSLNACGLVIHIRNTLQPYVYSVSRFITSRQRHMTIYVQFSIQIYQLREHFVIG